MKIKKWLTAKNIANLAGQYHFMHGNIWTKQMADDSIKESADVPPAVLEEIKNGLQETLKRGDKEINIKIQEHQLK